MTKRVVWKFPLGADTTIVLPRHAQPLHVAMQHRHLVMWVMVHPDADMVERRFITVGTGENFDSKGAPVTHVGTVLDGDFVWHVFEVST